MAIIGGGLAGLTCASQLNSKGISTILFDASNRWGGRVHSDTHDSYVIHNGFQIFLPRYAICRQLLNYTDLNLRYYPNGAGLITNDGPYWFGQPFSYPKSYQYGRKLPVTLNDYWHLANDVWAGIRFPRNHTRTMPPYSTLMRDYFIKPMFQGIFLNQHWSKNYAQFQYYLSCFFLGGAAIPSTGMQAIPNQLSASLTHAALNTPVKHVDLNGRITFENGSCQSYEHVVIATDMTTCYALLNQPPPPHHWNHEYATTLITSSPTRQAPLNLVSVSDNPVTLFSIPTLVSPDLAPSGTQSMTAISFDPSPPGVIETAIRNLTGESHWSAISQTEIKKATLTSSHRPPTTPDTVHICGDWTDQISIEGAMRSGYRVAQQISHAHR